MLQVHIKVHMRNHIVIFLRAVAFLKYFYEGHIQNFKWQQELILSHLKQTRNFVQLLEKILVDVIEILRS